MSLDYKRDWEALKDSAVRGVSEVFPVQGSKRSLMVEDVHVADDKEDTDYADQLKTKMKGGTWSVPVKGTAKLIDNQTGRVISAKKVTFANLPKLTPRLSYIVGGNEYQLDHLWVRKPGVYSRVDETGALESEFNLRKGRNFKLRFDPKTRDFAMQYGSSKIPLYPVMKAMGVDDAALHASWGKDVLAASRAHKEATALRKLDRALGGTGEAPGEVGLKLLRSFEQTQLSPDTTEITLKKAFDRVTPEVLMRASQQLLEISKGRREPDDRDSLIFKTLQGVEDKLYDRLAGKNKVRIGFKLRNRVDKAEDAREALGPGAFDPFIRAQFMGTGKEGSTLSNIPDQTNPVDWLMGATKTTSLAPDEGGIASEQQITDSVKTVNPSHVGFIDPIQSPEGSRAGITLYLPMGTRKEGDRLLTSVLDKKDKRLKYIDPVEFFRHAVVFPDQARRTAAGYVPIASKVKGSLPGNVIDYVDWRSARYLLPNPASILSVGSALVPFLNTNSGGRISMVGRHLQQAIPLVDRESPLVQVDAQAAHGAPITWEQALGRNVALRSKWDGQVVGVKEGQIKIKTKGGKILKQQLYHNFPLNEDGAFAHHTPTVKVGDKVRAGDILADDMSTRNGELALGRTLRTAYATIPGKTIEDGVVVSRSAADKLTSERLYKFTVDTGGDIENNPRKFSAYYPTAFKVSQLDKLDEDGVARTGQILQPNDPLATALVKTQIPPEAQLIKKLSRSAFKPYRDNSVKWDKDVPGEVVGVHKAGKTMTVLVKAREPLRTGDKITGRYGNKGVVADIIEDAEMPRDAQGNPMEVIQSPQTVPGRINLGQVYEALAGKVAKKTGKPIAVAPFSHTNYHAYITGLLKKNGVEDTEALYDPSGRKLGKALVGDSYFLKLRHMVEDKYSERTGGPGSPYDINNSPAGGSGERAQALGSLEQYALLSHGSRSILVDAHSRASDSAQQDEIWRALQLGTPLPPPKVPFVYSKFEGLLKGMGVATKKEGNLVSLLPMTDKDVREMSSGEIRTPDTLRAKDLRPAPGGLFDPRITKGPGGDAWAHIRLSEPMPNPLFEEGLRALTGLTKEELQGVVRGEKSLPRSMVKKAGITLAPGKGLMGTQGLKQYIDSIDVDKELDELKAAMPRLTGEGLNKANRRARALLALQATGMKPSDAYMLQNVPVVPPVLRPVMVKPDGNLSIDNLNELYRGLIISKDAFKEGSKRLPEKELAALRGDIYDGLSALVGTTSKRRVQGDEMRGILDIMRGNSPSTSFFQQQVVKRRQDLSARAVITPDPNLSIDEVGMPKKMAMAVYKPFVVRELRTVGYTPLRAQEAIKKNEPIVFSMLDKVIKERPVLMKRDPVLHRYGIMAFKPTLHEGSSIAMSPLLMGPFNADVDGDAMAVYTPMSPGAVKDAWNMLPSNHLFSPATGRVAYTPGTEPITGLYTMTRPGKTLNKRFSSLSDAKKAFYSGDIALNDFVSIEGKKTSVGRGMLYDALPKAVRDERLLTDREFVLDKGTTEKLLEGVGKANPKYYSDVAKSLMNLGNQALYDTAFSFSLKDFEPDITTREKYLGPIKRRLEHLDPATLVEELGKAADKMRIEHVVKEGRSPNSVLLMASGGRKPSWSQYQQLKLAPLLLTGADGKPIPHPIARSYAEGLDFGDYWQQTIGARRAVIGKVQGVSGPGALTKRMVNTVIGTVVTQQDCGTAEGEKLGLGHPDIVDRYLAKPIEIKGKRVGVNTLITPELVSAMRRAGLKQAEVRSTLHCKAPDGVCSHCSGGLRNNQGPAIGDNIGVTAAQSIGERSTQLSLKLTHEGGAYGHTAKAINAFDRVEQLLKLPKQIPDSATLSTTAGKVTSIEKDPVGGHNIYVAGIKHYVPGKLGLMPGLKVGAPVDKGDKLSTGMVNPHELLDISGLKKTQRYITDELDDIYSAEGIRRRHIETVVRGITGLVQVTDPGEATELLRGDVVPFSKVRVLNHGLSHKIQYRPVLKGVEQAPHDLHEDWIARLNHTRLKDTLLEAANRGLVSKVHSLNPVSALVRGDLLDEGAEY